MKRLITFFALVCIPSAYANQLQLDIPPKWTVEYQSLDGLDHHTIKSAGSGEALLFFSKWPSPSKPSDMENLVKAIAEGFVSEVGKSNRFALAANEYRLGSFSKIEGYFVVFELKLDGEKCIQTMFMFYHANKVWNGQFTGSENNWTVARNIINNLSRGEGGSP